MSAKIKLPVILGLPLAGAIALVGYVYQSGVARKIPYVQQKEAATALDFELGQMLDGRYTIRVIWLPSGDPRQFNEIMIEEDRSVYLFKRQWPDGFQPKVLTPASMNQFTKLKKLAEDLPYISASDRPWQKDMVWVRIVNANTFTAKNFTGATLPPEFKREVELLAGVTIHSS